MAIVFLFFLFFFFFFYFGHAARFAGCQFPDQGLNLGHSNESAES